MIIMIRGNTSSTIDPRMPKREYHHLTGFASILAAESFYDVEALDFSNQLPAQAF